MAACATTYFEAGRSWSARVAERNAELLAGQALRRRGVRTPEFNFPKSFDNSRLIKAPDPAHARQIRLFSAAITILFSLTMLYGLQHFSAIECGYRVEAEKQSIEQLREENRQSHCSRAACYNHRAVIPDCNISRPGNETGAPSSGDQDLSGSSYLCQSRVR